MPSRPTLAPTAAPPNAPRMWCDSRNIYAEIPSIPPYITIYPKTESGLQRALNLLRASEVAGPHYTSPSVTPSSEAARILREMGVL